MIFKNKIPLLLSSLAIAINLAGCNNSSDKKAVETVVTEPVINPGEADRAPSVWLKFNDDKSGDTIMQDVYVPKKGLTTYTYYSVLNWNAGMEGGGYAGIQDHPDGRNFIFSIWDPSNGETITAPFAGEGTKIENFGGEGTGLKSWNFSLGWQPDNWYTLVAKVWDVNDHTYFGYWSQDKQTGTWTHLVTMDYPVAKVRFNSSTGSFVEDWLGTGNHTRTALFSNGHKRLLDGSWLGFTRAQFEVIQEEATEDYNENYDATSTEDFYRLTSGGLAEPEDIEPVDSLARPYSPMTPMKAPTEVTITDVTNSTIAWTVGAQQTPQLKYSVLVNGTEVVSAYDSEARMASFSAINQDDIIELQIENILGKVTVYQATVADGVTPSSEEITIDTTPDTLVSGEATTIASLEKGQSMQFEVLGLASSTRLTFELAGGTGDADLYVKKGEPATPDNYDCASTAGGNLERCLSPTKKEEPYYALVTARSDVTNVSITASQDGSDDGMLNSATFIISADTPAQAGNELKFAFDNDPETMWHTSWGSDMQEYPHSFTIDLGKSHDINRFEYTPRKGGGNGTIVEYAIYISESSADYGEIDHAGTWPANGNLKLEVFGPITGRFIKFVALAEKNGGAWASAAEFRVGEVKEGYDPVPITGEDEETDGDGTGNEDTDGGVSDNGNIDVNSTLLDNSGFTYSSGSPAQPGNELALAFDGDIETFWHTNWDDTTVVYPHDVVIDLGASYKVNRFDYSPRVNGGNGTIVQYELYVSDSESDFGNAVSSGSWADNGDVKTATFAAVTGRYVKLVAIAERGGNPWAAAAEFNVGVDMTVTLDNTAFVVSSSSPAQPGNELALAFDGDSETFWHTNWDDTSVVYPHEVIIDLTASHSVVQLEYTPRAGGGNGTIVSYEIYVSETESDFGEAVASGTWPANGDIKTAVIPATTGRYVKFVALEERGGNPWAAAAEINIAVSQ